MALWGFDLAEVEIMQKGIKETERGVINSTEKSLCYVAFIFITFMGVILNDPSQFFYLMLISFDFVFIAGVLYTFWYFFIRNEIPIEEEVKEEPKEKNNEVDEFFNQELEINNSEVKKEDVIFQNKEEELFEENLNK